MRPSSSLSQNRVGTARCAVRAAFSGATIPPAVSRAGTSQRDVPTEVTFVAILGAHWRHEPGGTLSERGCVHSTSRSGLELRAMLRLGLRPQPRSVCRALAVLLFAAGSLSFAAESRLADAAEKSEHATIRTLLKQHADVNGPQAHGMTALHWPAYRDH